MSKPFLLSVIHDVARQQPEPLVVLPSSPRATHKRPWWLQGRMAQSNPFSALGLSYCTYCKQEVDVDTEAYHEGTVYVWRQRCLRCGQYCNFGIYQNVPLVNNPGIPSVALEWVFEPGKDRR